jgi:DNA-binding CsgD family transcriptional regulator
MSCTYVKLNNASLAQDRDARRKRAKLADLHQRLACLTPREREVLPLVVRGLLNKQAAAELGISEITLQIHRGQIMKKMGAGSLAELVRMAGVSFRYTDRASPPMCARRSSGFAARKKQHNPVAALKAEATTPKGRAMKRNLIAVIAAGVAHGANAALADPTLVHDESYWKRPEIVRHAEQPAAAESRVARNAGDATDRLFNLNP